MKELTLIRKGGSADGVRNVEGSRHGSHRCKAWRYTAPLRGGDTASAGTPEALKKCVDVDSGG